MQLLITLICIIGKTKHILHQIFDKANDIIKNYEKHSSICNIKAKYRGISKFSFRPIFFKVVKKIVRDLKINKAVSGEITTCIMKECEFTFDVLI